MVPLPVDEKKITQLCVTIVAVIEFYPFRPNGSIWSHWILDEIKFKKIRTERVNYLEQWVAQGVSLPMADTLMQTFVVYLKPN